MSMFERREQFGRKFIYFILILWFGSEVIFSSTIEKIFIWNRAELNDIMAIIILGLLLIQISFFQHYTLYEMVIVGVCSLPIIYSAMISDHNTMLSTWIFIVAAKYIDFDRVIKLAYYVELVLTLFVIYLYGSGFISEYTLYRGAVLRHSLGFSHPNQLAIRVFLLIVCRCYIRARKFNLLDWGLILIAAVFVNRVANSKTSFYALIILALIMAFYELARMIGANLDNYSFIMIVIAVISMTLSVFLSCNNIRRIHLLNIFDKLMSKRFSHCYNTLRYYGLTMFGQEIKLIFSRLGRNYHFWLDNAYMSILLRYGVIVFLLFSGLYISAMIYMKKMGRHLLVAILCLYSIYGIMENNFFSMSQNIFLLALSYFIYRRNEEDIQYEQPKAKIRLIW